MSVLDLQATTDGGGGYAPPGDMGDLGAGGAVVGIHGGEADTVVLVADTDDLDLGDDSDALYVPIDFAGFALNGLLAPEVAGEVKVLRAASAGTIPHDAGTSVAANRFACPGDTDLAVDIDTSIEIGYSAATSRWQVLGGAGGGGSIAVQEGGVDVVNPASAVNFGTGLDVSNSGGGVALVVVDPSELTPSAIPVKRGGAIVEVIYTFDTTTADADPGNGFLRLSNATQYLAVTCRADLLDAAGADVTALLDLIDDVAASGPLLGYLRLQHAQDPSKWLVASVSALASPSGYRNITIANIAKSANSPFTNGDPIVLTFEVASHTQLHTHAGAGDGTTLTPGTFNLPHASNPTPTAEGQAAWDDDDDVLKIGDGAATLTFKPTRKHIANCVVDGGSATIVAGSKIYWRVPWNCTITRSTVLTDRDGTITFDLRRCTYSQFDAGATHPVSGDSLIDTGSGGVKPSITSSGDKADDSTLAHWTTALTAGDVLEIYVDSCVTIRRATLAIELQP